MDNIGGKLILKNNWKINDDFDNLKLKVKFADRYQKEKLKDIKIILDYSIGNNVIKVRPSESWSPQYGYTNWIQGQTIRLYSDDSRRNFFYINGANPPDYTNSTILGEAIWDILGVRGIPTNLIAAYANNMFVDRVTSTGFGSYDMTKTFHASGNSQINLPSWATWSMADEYIAGTYSGADSYFAWDLLTTNNASFNLWPQAKVQYGIMYMGSFPVYAWTNYAGIRHTVN